MARVVITLKIMPDGIDVNMDDLLERVKGAIPEGTDVRANEVIPVAFGLKALRMNVVREESMGGTDDIEEAVTALDGVAQVEVEMVSRM
ncbi:MAG: elongation factor 1-beta [Candidatus Thorarchaeota archaeon]|nr:elongation factor 1-beta [Candidatus Thorarchaeota archaeon]